jgi:hypothetical protein
MAFKRILNNKEQTLINFIHDQERFVRFVREHLDIIEKSK